MRILKFTKNNIKNLTFIFFIGITFFTGIKRVTAQKKYVVVLDAGHGGKDPGNLGNGYREKNIALRVALDVGKELLTSRDIEVVYTRKKDVFVELHNRAKIANNKKADLFVSIHCDSYSKARAHGAGTFVLGLKGNSKNLQIAKRENASILYEDNYRQNYDYDPNSPESLIGLSVLQEKNLDNSLAIASHIQTNFSNLKRFDRKVKQDNFLVLRETIMPSVLVELGFLTNKAEGRFLNTRKGQIKMAKAIAVAIKKYVNQLKINTVGGSNPLIVQETKKEIVFKKKKVVGKRTVIKKSKIVTTKKNLQKVKSKTQNVTGKQQKKNSSLIEFKVQIAASKRTLTKNNFNLKGLKNVKSMFIDGYHKYYYGNTVVFQEVKRFLVEARKAGHKDAFVVAFKGGKKISIKEALKTK